MAFNILDAAQRLLSGSNTGFSPEEPLEAKTVQTLEAPMDITFSEQADVTAAANLWGMALAALIRDDVLTVTVLMRMGQELARSGVSTWRLVMRSGELSLQPARLTREGDTWTGTVELPDGKAQEVSLSDDAVLDVALPGRRSPIAGSSAAVVARSLEARTARDLNTGRVWTLEVDPIGHRAMTRSQRGEIGLSLSGLMASFTARGTNRVAALPPGVTAGDAFGSALPTGEMELRRIVRQTIEAAYGINGLLASDNAPDATGDAWRVASRRTFLPLSRLIADEARRKLEREVEVLPRALIPNSDTDRAQRAAAWGQALGQTAAAFPSLEPQQVVALVRDAMGD